MPFLAVKVALGYSWESKKETNMLRHIPTQNTEAVFPKQCRFLHLKDLRQPYSGTNRRLPFLSPLALPNCSRGRTFR
jgi:hypothetical protein